MKSDFGALGGRLSPLSMSKDVMSTNKLMSAEEGIPLPANKPKIWSLADTAACKTPPPNVTAGQTQWLSQGYSQPLPPSFTSNHPMYNRYSNLFPSMPSSSIHNPTVQQHQQQTSPGISHHQDPGVGIPPVTPYSNTLSSCASAAMGGYNDSSVPADTPPQTPPNNVVYNNNNSSNNNNQQLSSPEPITAFRPIYKTPNPNHYNIPGR